MDVIELLQQDHRKAPPAEGYSTITRLVCRPMNQPSVNTAGGTAASDRWFQGGPPSASWPTA